MVQDNEELKKEIEVLEAQMAQGNFWENKVSAQATIKRIAFLKDEILGNQKYDKGYASVIFTKNKTALLTVVYQTVAS